MKLSRFNFDKTRGGIEEGERSAAPRGVRGTIGFHNMLDRRFKDTIEDINVVHWLRRNVFYVERDTLEINSREVGLCLV